MLFNEPKLLKYTVYLTARASSSRFSALQRAENSSIENTPDRDSCVQRFQCSSASRKFLNKTLTETALSVLRFQCSSASRKFLNSRAPKRCQSGSGVSVLFSEPKIPQWSWHRSRFRPRNSVSVLFSEPKIPQSIRATPRGRSASCFSRHHQDLVIYYFCTI